MSALKFYFDTHIAKAIADQLRVRGVDVIRCEEVGMAAAKDFQHLEYAAAAGRAIVSHDQDFLRLDGEWRAANKSHSGIFFLQEELQGKVGPIFNALQEYVEWVEAGAATLEKDVINQIIYIGRGHHGN
jgi:predicted nuclease of predicted toxin-antitoxin system